VNVLADMPEAINNEAFEAEYKAVPGQGSGVSLRYFYMLTGVEDQIKPDRMIIRFISSALNRTVTMDECHPLLLATCKYLLEKHALYLKPSALDHVIWRFQSAQRSQKPDNSTSQAIVTTDDEILSGTKVFSGTRVPVQNLIDYLTTGETIDTFLDDFPTVSKDQIVQLLNQKLKQHP
jgi:uncharacterized protein (DUF433 family)